MPVLGLDRLQRILDRLPVDVVRVKGTVETTDGPRLVQCVGARRRLDRWTGPAAGTVVVIGLTTTAVDQAVAMLSAEAVSS